jgi:hypothetical protein
MQQFGDASSKLGTMHMDGSAFLPNYPQIGSPSHKAQNLMQDFYPKDIKRVASPMQHYGKNGKPL